MRYRTVCLALHQYVSINGQKWRRKADWWTKEWNRWFASAVSRFVCACARECVCLSFTCVCLSIVRRVCVLASLPILTVFAVGMQANSKLFVDYVFVKPSVFCETTIDTFKNMNCPFLKTNKCVLDIN